MTPLWIFLSMAAIATAIFLVGMLAGCHWPFMDDPEFEHRDFEPYRPPDRFGSWSPESDEHANHPGDHVGYPVERRIKDRRSK